MSDTSLNPTSATREDSESAQVALSPSRAEKPSEKILEQPKIHSAERQRILGEVLKHCSGKLRQFESAYTGKSRKNAITAKCLDCCCYQQEEVRLCQATECPLWEYRPYKETKSEEVGK